MISYIPAASLFASLGLVALAIGLLARRCSKPALGIGLAGLLGLTTASTWMTYAAAMPDDIVAKLREELAAMRDSLHREKARADELASKQRGSDHVRDETVKAAEGARDDAIRARKAAETERDEAKSKLARLEAAQPQPIAATTAKPSPPPAPNPKDVVLATSAHYSIEKRGEPEIATGLNGDWYVVRLNTGAGLLEFESRQVDRLAKGTPHESAMRFKSEVFDKVGPDAGLYIRCTIVSCDVRARAATRIPTC
jgi:hypothetical protein